MTICSRDVKPGARARKDDSWLVCPPPQLVLIVRPKRGERHVRPEVVAQTEHWHRAGIGFRSLWMLSDGAGYSEIRLSDCTDLMQAVQKAAMAVKGNQP